MSLGAFLAVNKVSGAANHHGRQGQYQYRPEKRADINAPVRRKDPEEKSAEY